ncbi:hypothetical protein PHYC_03814 [Phycisphaerales bacterium]|nr:hypothetical protein PHYC_03814 [Phycisphaerales bacterium]
MDLIPTLTLASAEEVIVPMAIGGGLLVAIISIISSAVRATVASREREQTRRELAAYVAEGSISPEDAEKILAAGESRPGKRRKSCCATSNAA